MKRIEALAIAIAFTAIAGGQVQIHPKKRQGSPSVDNDPVSCAEARAAFKRVSSLLFSLARHNPTFAPDPIPDSPNPVTRAEVVEELDNLFEGMRPYFKVTPRLAWFDPTLVSFSGDAKSKASQLIKWGFLDRMAALTTSKQPGISVSEFGDAVGIFIARTADLTHMPMPDYSPYLEKQ